MVINLSLDSGMYLRFAGSGGELYMFGNWSGGASPHLLRMFSGL